MSGKLDMSKARIIAPQFDNRGNAFWQTRMSPPDDTFAMCLMVPDRIVPVIFVPGVMGSNLIEKNANPDKAIQWRMDSATSALPWSYVTRDAKFRKRYLKPDVMEVDKGGQVPTDLLVPAEELSRRGWGEIGAMSYKEFLVWLEAALNDFADPHAGERVALMKRDLQALVGEEKLSHDEVGLSYKYRFPLYACGYNWLASNAESAAQLGRRIDEVLERYRKEKKKVEKVIIVTHSMGGLVARHCSEVGGYKDKIFGIVHGVMPAIGAAAVYRRFKAGTEDPTAWWNAAGAIGASVLGNDAAEMTAVLSSAPGPLQLLPTPEYGNGWLKIKDGGTEYSLPQNGDPYGEVYAVRGKWWSMCEDQLINPLNEESDPKKRRAAVDADWVAFANTIRKSVKKFHEEIEGQYHSNTHAFFGHSGGEHKAYGTVTWTRSGWAIHTTNVLDAKLLPDSKQVNEKRSVEAEVLDPGWQRIESQTYKISAPDEEGDGTVPHRSGVAPKAVCKSFMQVSVGHEPAYKASEGADNLRACRFTLRAIVKIAQQVTQTSLKYE